jgi:hypothetical protein
MTRNIVLDVNVFLDLLLKRPPSADTKADLFSRFSKAGEVFHLAAGALPSLEYIPCRVDCQAYKGCISE